MKKYKKKIIFFTNSSVNRYCKVIPVVVESYTRVFDKTFLVEHQPGLEGLHPYLKLVVDLGVPLPTGVTSGAMENLLGSLASARSAQYG